MPKAKSELTSKRVASIAGRLLADLDKCKAKLIPSITQPTVIHAGARVYLSVSLSELKSLAGSALTQTADKK